MNPKAPGGGSGRSSPRVSTRNGNGANTGSNQRQPHQDSDEDMESGLSEEEETNNTARPPRTTGRSQRRRQGTGAGNPGGHALGGNAKEAEAEEDSSEEEEVDEIEEEEEEEEEEDSSDLDVQECERRRTFFMEELIELDKEFSILREQLYRERITQIEAKLAEVKAGKATEYLQPLEELQVNMKNRLEVGHVLREYRLTNIQCKYDAEMLAAEQNFRSEKELLWDSMKADLEEKIRLLEEDKHNVDFSSGLWEQSSFNRAKRRKADPLDPDRRKKPVTVTGPFIVYMLEETDIMNDWAIIKKALSQRKKVV